ncbi:universal stress protein [Parvularcula sp. ZS-1/3]|uniref:Universal stress protein n=1 Tax=Parvularcula mediterranea TaxID=2732508 RepID=A0A7Y3RNX3_9PROT|nr:universal stress protein [Parvularcula mediterranea]NNU17567.1 universal stress protein [Parvularcula mediterranea]
MTIGTVLVPAFDDKGIRHAVRAAMPFVQKLRASLNVLHVRERYPAAHVAEYYWHTEVLKEFAEKVAQRAQELRVAAEEAAGRSDFTWLQPEGVEEADFGPASRMADLIVAPPPNVCGRPDAQSLVEQLMIGSGRPVLLTPEDAEPRVPSSYLVGWNGSIEATRALAAARPLLETAKRVTVVSVGEIDRPAPDASVIAEALNNAGIKAEGRTVGKIGTVTETLKGEASEAGADVLLLGAYSHSRLRERVLGGVTRKTIRQPFMPTLLVH